jgi:hypothetical protein
MSDDDKTPAQKLPEIGAMLAEWTAHAAHESAALLQRLEGMGYDVAGRSEAEIVEILKKPPTKATSN